MIEEGVNGFIVDPYQAKVFAEKMENLLKDEKLRLNMREQSADVLEKFKFTNISKGYMAAIEESLRK